MTSTVHTLGDSTFDNVYWALNGLGSNLKEALAKCTEGQLQKFLGRAYQVVSHAYDGFTTQDVLGERFRSIGEVLPGRGKKFQAYYNHKNPEDKPYVCPLDDLANSLPSDGHHYVIISVGGNDFRENLLNPCRLISDISKVQDRYLQIVERVEALSTDSRTVSPILMFQYRTDANQDVYCIYKLFGAIGVTAFIVNLLCIGLIFVPLVQVAVGVTAFQVSMVVCPVIGLLGMYLMHKLVPLSVSKDICLLKSPSMSLFDALLERFYQPILSKARDARIPILDLPNTFNPYEKLYTSGIEPNAQGSTLIAEGLAHIVREHSFDGESMIYAKIEDVYVGLPNTQDWSVAYPQS